MRPVEAYWDVPGPPLPRELWTGGELLAVRIWRLVRWSEDGSVRLQSVWRDDVWPGPVFTADHKPLAEPDSISGVYALKECYCIFISRYGSPGAYTYEWLSAPNWIWGWVALVGQVVDHQYGFRAERAVVRSLHLGMLSHLAFEDPTAFTGLIRQLEDRYQCPVQPGHWVCDEAFRTEWLAYEPGRRLPSLEIVGPGAGDLGSQWRGTPGSTQPHHYAQVATPSVPPAAPVEAPATQPESKTKALVKTFQKAEQKLDATWPLKGRGHCRRVTLRSWCSRVVRWAAGILGGKLEILIGREY